jgi:exopolysaccharide biosynthesis polyprenyl glycosylphosphotransferase
MWNNRSPRLSSRSAESRTTASDCALLSEECFAQMLHMEQKRTERSGKCLVLMLVEFNTELKIDKPPAAIGRFVSALFHSTRETDVKGWYKSGSTLGVVFTEIATTDADSVSALLLKKVRRLLSAALEGESSRIESSTRIYPRNWEEKLPASHPGSALPAEFRGGTGKKLHALVVKRSIDIIGSLLALIAFSPLFAVIALVIKFTSKGPVLFRQQRVGQFGQWFEFLKFRSMHVGNNQAIHQEFVKELIAGGVGSPSGSSQQKPVYKLTNDPRVTRVGKFLRRTSLDELPQFLNVLKGQMSLVGPRPPIPYEVECYESWHWRRLLAVKPGITGLWQVSGRSRTTFDEMVRLDLQYARTWSIWKDIRILLQTPRAMVSGDGAH